MVKNQGTKQRGQRILGDCWQWETNGQCVKGNNCSFRHDMNKRGKSSPSNPSPNSFMRQNERKPSRTRSPRGKSPSGRMSRWPCKDYLGGTCNNSFCEKWHPPECSFAHHQVDEQPTKRSKSNNDKSAVAMLKKGNWQERESVSDACHDRTGQLVKRSDKKLGQKLSQRRFSDARARKLAAEEHETGSEFSRTCVDDEDDSKWPHNLRTSRAHVPHVVAAQSLHISCQRSTPRESLREFETTTQTRARRRNGISQFEYDDMANVYVGHSASRNSYGQQLFGGFTFNQKSVTKNNETLFDVTKKLVSEQTEIHGMLLINWHDKSWKKDDIVERPSSSVVNSESPRILCMGRIPNTPVSAWKEKITWFVNSSHC